MSTSLYCDKSDSKCDQILSTPSNWIDLKGMVTCKVVRVPIQLQLIKKNTPDRLL